ncbi:putative DHH phosphoesterase [Vibrio nigripulchritudo SOn1]|uniref:DHH phosphoesterase n=1 Tax=Vibrio nigripulchritudo SOn1 TaxID=1238450 RepID=A0AAV2VR53_9VIBR|nr:DHH family phosphoesterase [Vibrio nigripulchritudo]CCO47164.1 putative DHH phosphoesterase [Vibrio nigripulchritudo SOn1]
MNYDVFNGDADGIIALLQLRLKEPRDAQLVTGVKRDIKLLGKIEAQNGDQVTVLDISMEKNIDALHKVLEAQSQVFYADHHRPGDIPASEFLHAHIDTDPNTCTALIIDKLLEGKFRLWAITAAYGDNMIATADALADEQGLNDEQKALLKEFGTLLNYNGYGAKEDDLHYHPADLFKALLPFSSPFDAINSAESPYHVLKAAYEEDFANALAAKPVHQSDKLAVIQLPNEAWSGRISGVLGNHLANQTPDSAHAIVTQNADSTFTISLRAPLSNKQGAGQICSEFPSGGGREAAAGINALPADSLSAFIQRVESFYA